MADAARTRSRPLFCTPLESAKPPPCRNSPSHPARQWYPTQRGIPHGSGIPHDIPHRRWSPEQRADVLFSTFRSRPPAHPADPLLLCGAPAGRRRPTGSPVWPCRRAASSPRRCAEAVGNSKESKTAETVKAPTGIGRDGTARERPRTNHQTRKQTNKRRTEVRPPAQATLRGRRSSRRQRRTFALTSPALCGGGGLSTGGGAEGGGACPCGTKKSRKLHAIATVPAQHRRATCRGWDPSQHGASQWHGTPDIMVSRLAWRPVRPSTAEVAILQLGTHRYSQGRTVADKARLGPRRVEPPEPNGNKTCPPASLKRTPRSMPAAQQGLLNYAPWLTAPRPSREACSVQQSPLLHPLQHPPLLPLQHPPLQPLQHPPLQPLQHPPLHPLQHPPLHPLQHRPLQPLQQTARRSKRPKGTYFLQGVLGVPKGSGGCRAGYSGYGLTSPSLGRRRATS